MCDIIMTDQTKNNSSCKAVAIVSSTGGPKALQEVLINLPRNLDAPVFIVQHMPAGFTAPLSERLDSICDLKIQEAVDGTSVRKGNVYIAKGGIHMTLFKQGQSEIIKFLDEPSREGLKPCANYMFESLEDSIYNEIVCVVLTGMGADGTIGISSLKKKKKLYVLAQEQSTCAVYGMPKCVVNAGLVDEIEPINKIAESIRRIVGVS